MSECCSVPAGECRLPQATQLSVCPHCHKKGKSVPTLTVKNLVRDHIRVSASGSYLLCRTPECDVVYFSDNGVFRKPDLKVRVGLKEQEDSAPLCYCFDYTRGDIRRDLEKHGATKIPERIKAEVQAGFCACEAKNPSGTCCLGEINRAITEAKNLASLTR
ncbi:MAG: copper chaperone Copz family protein [Acidobacteria bacterium]|nr:copper chaperone Copz family protein [Acidobacteriota bacterium]